LDAGLAGRQAWPVGGTLDHRARAAGPPGWPPPCGPGTGRRARWATVCSVLRG